MKNRLRRSIALLAVALLFFPTLYSQVQDKAPISVVATTWAGDLQRQESIDLADKFEHYDIMQIDAKSFFTQVKKDLEPDVVNLRLGRYGKLSFELIENDIRSKDYYILVADDHGVHRQKSPVNKTFKGHLSNDASKHLRLTLDGEIIYGYIQTTQGELFIEPLWYYEADAPKDLFILYYAKDAIIPAGQLCGTDHTMTPQHSPHTPSGQSGAQLRTLSGCYEIEMAIANDYSMFQKYGSVGGVESHALTIMSMVSPLYSGVFTHDYNFISLAPIFVATTSSSDPFTTSTNAGQVLSNFTGWAGGGFGYSFDEAQLWTNRNFDGSTIGIAWLNSICSGSSCMALQDFTNSATLKRTMVAHEIGHNCSAQHDGSSGFIMSPTVSNATAWSSNSISSISSFLQGKVNSGCLSSCSGGGTPPTASFTYSASSICQNQQVHFTDNSTGGATDWSWSFPGGTPSTSTQQNPTVTYFTPGNYSVSLTASNASGSNTFGQNQVIIVDPLPVPQFSYSLNNSTQVTFTNTSAYGTTYLWDFGDSSPQVTQANPTHTFPTDGIYNVTLFSTNNCGTEFTIQQVVIVTPPTAGFQSDIQLGCAPLNVSFSNASSSNATSFLWQFPGGTPAQSTNINETVTYNNPGIYDVKLTVYNSAGSDSSVYLDYIYVYDSPASSFNYSNNQASFSFTNSSSNSTSYLWDFADGNTSTQVNPSHTFTEEGTYPVMLIATNSCSSDTSTLMIEYYTPPTAGLAANITEICPGDMVQFSNQSSANALSWNWSFSGGTPNTSTEENPIIQYDQSGLHTVTLIVHNPAGSDTITEQAYIEVLSAPVAGFNANTNGGLDISLTNTATNWTSILYNFGDGNSSTDPNPSHNYATAGTYTIEQVVTNNCDIVTTTTTVSVLAAPIPVIVAGQTTGCTPLTVSYDHNSTGSPDTWAWSFPGGTPATSTDPSPTVTYNQAGTYDVTLMVSNSAGSNSTTEASYVTVHDVPMAAFNASVQQHQVSFTNQSTGGNIYLWDFGDGATSTDFEPSHNYGADGTYITTLTVMNDCGQTTITQTIVITSFPVAAFSASAQEVCIGETITYQNQSSSNATSFEWTFEGGTPSQSTETSPEITYNQAGTYSVQLIASNSTFKDTVTYLQHVNILPEPVAGFSYTTNSLSIQTTNNGANGTVTWDFGDGNTSTEWEPTHTYSAEDVYTITQTITSLCGTVTSTEAVNLISAPTASFDLPTSGCAPFEITLANTSVGAQSTYEWTMPGADPAKSTDYEPTISYATPGTYMVTLVVTNITGSDTYTSNITIGASPVADFSVNTGGLTVSTTNTSTDATSFEWYMGDGTTYTTNTVTHTYATTGTYTITLIANGPCGKNQLVSDIAIEGTAPVAAFSISPTAICVNETIEFTSTTIGNADQFYWSFEGATPASATSMNPTAVYPKAGDYVVQLIVENLFGRDTAEQMITVLEYPDAQYKVTKNGATIDGLFTGSGAGTISWDTGDGSQYSGSTFVHTYAESGVYTLVCTVINDCGQSSFTQEVEIKLVGIEDSPLAGNWMLYPNPFIDQLSLNYTGILAGNYQITVHNSIGMTLFQKEFYLNTSGNLYLNDWYNWPKGTYYLKITNETGAQIYPVIKI